MSESTNTGTSPSLTADFVQSLRMEILAGTRTPGERVPLEGLRQAYGISLSPIREGLSRLVAEGLLIPVGQRGYRVAPVSLEEFIDIKTLRVDLELKALRESIRHGDESWDLSLMAALQRLRNFEQKRWLADEVDAWEERHHAFHSTLIGACQSPILIQFCKTLHDMGDRYRRVFLKAHEPDRDVTQEHLAMYQAAVDRNADVACDILRNHIERTGMNVLAVMRERADR
ncbi:GntR family transcriptional regulator [Pararobbsia alpina]|uniref:HTH-type transcriptional repressor GlaR n=1 Tax=Pararobbsia alpina TaxID=621374 RepID=A0A6S7BDG3_9BURK|nr:FCD domain-containing protein [Pararobbsia alpina]CAB3796261.1 HTH-type transcriptional repressor GlaR [Pararobbsia alpina]